MDGPTIIADVVRALVRRIAAAGGGCRGRGHRPDHAQFLRARRARWLAVGGVREAVQAGGAPVGRGAAQGLEDP